MSKNEGEESGEDNGKEGAYDFTDGQNKEESDVVSSRMTLLQKRGREREVEREESRERDRE